MEDTALPVPPMRLPWPICCAVLPRIARRYWMIAEEMRTKVPGALHETPKLTGRKTASVDHTQPCHYSLRRQERRWQFYSHGGRDFLLLQRPRRRAIYTTSTLDAEHRIVTVRYELEHRVY